jgi:hypothetical protein
MQLTHSLKAPGFNSRTCRIEKPVSKFVFLQMQLVYHYIAGHRQGSGAAQAADRRVPQDHRHVLSDHVVHALHPLVGAVAQGGGPVQV